MELTYCNPLYEAYLADPFVLGADSGYYAYGTGQEAGSVPVLHSHDLVQWESAGQALVVQGKHIWAPEVAYADGQYWMYYSAGEPDGKGHQINVAQSDHPAGPFAQIGILTPTEPFAIDAHPFRDADGTWYLYYAKDFLDGEFRGTGIVVDRLVDMTRLEDMPTVVVRPHANWHLFEANRDWGGRIADWYTVEGPFLATRGGRYYCTYSGGSWQSSGYGVDYVVGDTPRGPFRHAPTTRPRIIRSQPHVPDAHGPGHASILHDHASGSWLVYHAWDRDYTRRTMRIDPLLWVDGAPMCDGPSAEWRPAPRAAPHGTGGWVRQ